MARPWSQPLPSRPTQAWGDAPSAPSALSGDALSGGPTTGASSNTPTATALRADRLGPANLSRLFQAANVAVSAEPAFEFLPTHSRTDLGQPCAATPWRGGTARVNGIARPSRNGRCQSSRRLGKSSRCRSGTAPEVTPPGLPRAPRGPGPPRRTPHRARRVLAGDHFYEPPRGRRHGDGRKHLAWHRLPEPADA